MVFATRRQRLNLPVAPLAAAFVGGLAALAFALLPGSMLEDFVLDSGIAAVIPAAEPPLGVTARAVLILAGGGGAALILWFGLFLLLGSRTIVIQGTVEDGEEPPLVLRRADAHPDAPARRPLFANRDLGTPFLEVRAERPVHVVAEERAAATFVEPITPVERELPVDLDQPLAAFDPQAIPDEPIDWFPTPAPLLPVARQQVFDPGERFETFELTPMTREAVESPAAAPAPIPAPAPAPIFRLEPVTSEAPVDAEPMVSYRPLPVPEPASWPEQDYRSAIPIPAPMPAFAPEPRPRGSARVELDPSASIHALLDRLERGVGRRETVAAPVPAPTTREDRLEEALTTLRQLAMRG